jgi:hypothetical protein
MTTSSGGELIMSSVLYCGTIAHVGRASTRHCLSRRFQRSIKPQPLPSRDTRVSFRLKWSLAFFQLHLCFMHAVCHSLLALHAANISAICLHTAFMHSHSSALLPSFVLLCSLSSALLSQGDRSGMNCYSLNLLLIQPIFGFAAFVVHLPEHRFVQADHEGCSVHTPFVTTASMLFLCHNSAPVCYACSLSKSLAIFLGYLALRPHVQRAIFLAWHSTLPSPNFCLQRLRLPFPSSLAFAISFSVIYFGIKTSISNLAVLCPFASFKFCIDFCLFYLSTKSIRPCLNETIYLWLTHCRCSCLNRANAISGRSLDPLSYVNQCPISPKSSVPLCTPVLCLSLCFSTCTGIGQSGAFLAQLCRATSAFLREHLFIDDMALTFMCLSPLVFVEIALQLRYYELCAFLTAAFPLRYSELCEPASLAMVLVLNLEVLAVFCIFADDSLAIGLLGMAELLFPPLWSVMIHTQLLTIAYGRPIYALPFSFLPAVLRAHGGFDFAFATYIRHSFVAPVLGQHDRSVPITSRSAQIQAIFSKSEACRPAAVEPYVSGSQAYPRHSILRRRLSSRGSKEPFLCCLQLMLCLSCFRRRLSSLHRPHLFRCSDVTFSMLVKTAFLMAYALLLGSTVAFLVVLVLIRECLMAICPFGRISLHSFRSRTCSCLQMMVTMRSSVNLVIDASGARVLSGWPRAVPFAHRVHRHCFQV